MNLDIEDAFVPEDKTIKETMKDIDKTGIGVAFIVDKNKKLVGIATDGDIRRAILAGTPLDTNIKKIMNKIPITTRDDLPRDELVSKLMSRGEVIEKIPLHGIMKVPVLDDKGRVKDILFISSEKMGKSLAIKPRLEKKDILKKILVIGGAGYIGSVVVRKLLEKGYKVRVFDNLLHGDDGIKELYSQPNFEFLKGDILNINSVAMAIKDVDAVVHLAAIVGDPAGKIKPELTIEINYLATKTIAEICKYYQINRFIFASTCSVYGSSSGSLLKEDASLNPVSLYGRTKLESENGILSLVDENFSPTIFRFATVYGLSPRMRFDLVVNLLTAKAIKEGKIGIFGGKQWRPFMHVYDVARAIIACLEAPIGKVSGEIFNAGSNEQNYQISKLGEIIKNKVPTVEVNIIKEKEDERTYRVSFDKIKNILRFEAKKSIEDGILEIKKALEDGKIKDYKDKKYSNR